jgi:hypothetical protein
VTAVTDPVYAPQRPASATPVVVALRLVTFPLALAALPVFLAAGYGFGSWLLAFALWTVNVAIQWASTRFLIGLPQTLAVAVAGGSMLARAWGVMIALLVTVYMAGEDVAVPAAILFALLYTVDLVVRGLLAASARRQPVGPEPQP